MKTTRHSGRDWGLPVQMWIKGGVRTVLTMAEYQSDIIFSKKSPPDALLFYKE